MRNVVFGHHYGEFAQQQLTIYQQQLPVEEFPVPSNSLLGTCLEKARLIGHQ